MASSSSTVKFRVKSQNHKEKQQPLDRSLQNRPPREEDSPMTDFLDVKLAHVTKQEYTRQLQRFFDFLQLHGDLDKQSRAFLTQARKNRVWAQDGLKYYMRAAKKRAEAGEIAESTIRNLYKPIRLFCSVHDIELSWKKITDMIPTGRRVAKKRFSI